MNYDFCDDMYVHDPPQASESRISEAQTVDGNLSVRAPGFRPSASPFLGATLRTQSITSSPSSNSQHLKISFHFFSPSFPGSSSSSVPFQFWSEDLFWVSYPPPFFPGDPPNLSFAPLSILLYFLFYSTLLFLKSS